MAVEPDDPITITLPTKVWKLVSFLANSGFNREVERFVEDKHEVRCILDFAEAAQLLHAAIVGWADKPN